MNATGTLCRSCGTTYSGNVAVCTKCRAVMGSGSDDYRAGDVIDGKYEVASLLGVGGMGQVYKVRHLHLETFRTIKMLRKDFLADEGYRSRFVREARLATRVQHVNVALLHDFATLPDGTFYMVSEFIDGVTLRQWARRHGKMSLELSLQIGAQVLEGLDAIHVAGLMHRDLSMDNVMITSGVDQRLLAKIIDLGIAKTVDSAGAADSTQAGVFVGNPRYSSPEQLGALRAGEEVDARADIYAAGLLLYEMVAGEPPFTSNNPHGYAMKHLSEKPLPLRTRMPMAGIPEMLDKAVLKALEKNREERFQSARELAAAIAPLITGALSATTETKLDGIRESGSRKTQVTDLSTLPGKADDEPDLHQQIATYRERADVSGLTRLAGIHPPETEIGKEVRATLDAMAEDLFRAEADREQRAWEEARAIDTEAAWNSYLLSYSDSYRGREARKLRDERRHFSAVMKTPSAAALRSFMNAWPDSKFEAQIRAAIEQAEKPFDERAAFHAAVAALEAGDRGPAEELQRTASATHIRQTLKVRLEQHLRDRRVNAESSEVQAWNAAWNAGTEEAWMVFLEKHGQSPRAKEAIPLLAETRDYHRAAKANSEQAWRIYQATWPRGRHAAEAAAHLTAMLGGSAYVAPAVPPPPAPPVRPTRSGTTPLPDMRSVPATRVEMLVPQTAVVPFDAAPLAAAPETVEPERVTPWYSLEKTWWVYLSIATAAAVALLVFIVLR